VINATIRKFQYPDSLVHEYENWVVLLRPEQVTAGSLILACKGDITRMSEVSTAAYAELSSVIVDVERVLQTLLAYDKINYLLLMMVDNHVHFHILPRFSSPRDWCGVTFVDASWPGPPSVSEVVGVTPQQCLRMLAQLKGNWPMRSSD